MEADLYFVGQAKSRYQELIKIFEFCEKNNLSTNFYIIGVAKEKQLYKDKIHYIDFIPYEKVLEIMSRSNCGVELLVEGATSYSQRVQEALVNNKKLLSNNPWIKEASFYDPKRIQIYKQIEEISPEFVRERLPEEEYENI